MKDKLAPIHPGEVLLEEFLKPMELSQNRLACLERFNNGDRKACRTLKDHPACECQYLHYVNMIEDKTVKKVACGIYVTPQGKYYAVMNFFS